MNKPIVLLFLCLFFSCDDNNQSNQKKEMEQKDLAKEVSASKRIDLVNKGVGSVISVDLNPEIDQQMADKGKEVFDKMCTACHKIDKKFIGPSPLGILKRRTPEWIMNMILDPDRMVKEDDLAKELLIEFNGSPMANQGLTEIQAREVLEYFRTLKDYNSMTE